MYPVLFSISGLPVYSYGVFVTLGFVVLVVVVWCEARRLGVLIGGYAGVVITKRAPGVKQMLGDPFALGLPAMMVLVRIGCFLGGCCYGKPTNLPWAVNMLGHSRLAGLRIPVPLSPVGYCA